MRIGFATLPHAATDSERTAETGDANLLFIRTLETQRDVNPPPPSQAITKKCVICGIEYLGWPLSQYCSNGCAIAGHREWIRQGKNPSKAQLKSLRQQSHFKLILVSYGYE